MPRSTEILPYGLDWAVHLNSFTFLNSDHRFPSIKMEIDDPIYTDPRPNPGFELQLSDIFLTGKRVSPRDMRGHIFVLKDIRADVFPLSL